MAVTSQIVEALVTTGDALLLVKLDGHDRPDDKWSPAATLLEIMGVTNETLLAELGNIPK